MKKGMFGFSDPDGERSHLWPSDGETPTAAARATGGAEDETRQHQEETGREKTGFDCRRR